MDDAEKWERFSRACRRGHMDPMSVINDCRSGRAQFHDAPDGVAVTMIEQMTTGHKRLTITLIAGNMDGVRQLIAKTNAFAKETGCDTIWTIGRPGWRKVFEDFDDGWQHVADVYEKRVEE